MSFPCSTCVHQGSFHRSERAQYNGRRPCGQVRGGSRHHHRIVTWGWIPDHPLPPPRLCEWLQERDGRDARGGGNRGHPCSELRCGGEGALVLGDSFSVSEHGYLCAMSHLRR